MNPLRIRGVILREVPVGEADKILTILTREDGLITVSAKNARRPKSKMLFSTSVLVFGEFELFGNESRRYYLSQANIIEPFTSLRENIVALTYCAHIMDVVLDTMRDSSSSSEVYELLIYTLHSLCKPDINIDLIVHTFELKLLFMIGFLPVLNSCFLCDKEPDITNNQSLIFSFSHCGICCNDDSCIKKAQESMIISCYTWNCLKYICASSIEKLYSFKLDKNYLNELSELATRYLSERLERNYCKLKMLDDLNI